MIWANGTRAMPERRTYVVQKNAGGPCKRKSVIQRALDMGSKAELLAKGFLGEMPREM